MGSEQPAITRQFYVLALVLVLFAVLDGLALGMLTGLRLQSIDLTRNPQADQDDFIALVGASYANTHDLAEAAQRLSMIAPDPSVSAKIVAAAAQRVSIRGDSTRAGWITALAQALVGDTTASNLLSPEPPSATPTSTPVVLAELDTATPVNSMTPTPTAGQSPLANASGRPPAPTSTPTRTVRPTATRTPKPAATLKPIAQPQPTQTSTPTATRPAPPQNTATSTATLVNTATATSTPTQPPPQGTATATATPAQLPPQNSPTATLASSSSYRVTLERQLTPCENEGNHNIYVVVLDAQGNGIPGVQVEMVWPSGSTRAFTGQKVEYIPYLGVNAKTTPGYLNFALFKGSYRVHILGATSDWSSWLSVDIPTDELCPTTDNPVANSLFHYSYLVDFQKVR